jgi:HEAT repeat protein
MTRTRVIVFCLLAALAIVLAAATLRGHEPVYQGRTLSQWLEEAAACGSWPRQRPVAVDEAIRQIGTNGFPVIIRLLRSHDSALKSRFVALFYKQSLIRINIPTQNTLHFRALAGCWALGSEGKELVPEVAKALNHMDPYFRPAFDLWLQSLGPDADAAAPDLIALLKDKGNPSRQTVAQTLGKVSMQHRPEAISALIVCSQDTNEMVRFWAAEALKELGQPQQTMEAKAQ